MLFQKEEEELLHLPLPQVEMATVTVRDLMFQPRMLEVSADPTGDFVDGGTG